MICPALIIDRCYIDDYTKIFQLLVLALILGFIIGTFSGSFAKAFKRRGKD